MPHLRNYCQSTWISSEITASNYRSTILQNGATLGLLLQDSGLSDDWWQYSTSINSGLQKIHQRHSYWYQHHVKGTIRQEAHSLRREVRWCQNLGFKSTSSIHRPLVAWRIIKAIRRQSFIAPRLSILSTSPGFRNLNLVLFNWRITIIKAVLFILLQNEIIIDFDKFIREVTSISNIWLIFGPILGIIFTDTVK